MVCYSHVAVRRYAVVDVERLVPPYRDHRRRSIARTWAEASWWADGVGLGPSIFVHPVWGKAWDPFYGSVRDYMGLRSLLSGLERPEVRTDREILIEEAVPSPGRSREQFAEELRLFYLFPS